MVHYFDNAASSPLRAEALEAMVPALAETYANPTGAHRLARHANRVVDDARDIMAGALGASPGQVVFTSGGTEADSLAVRGAVEARPGRVVCSAVEHHAVLYPVEQLGGQVVGVGRDGQIDLGLLAESLDSEVSLVSVMAANNETGIVQPLAEVVELVRRLAPNALVHTDAVQALCWLDLAEIAPLVDLVSVSGHKFGGPKGVGALVVGEGARVAPQLLGGAQERNRRAGTHNTPAIVGMAAAAAATVATRSEVVERVSKLRDRLCAAVVDQIEGVVVTGTVDGVAPSRTANVAHFCFEDVESEALLFLLEKNDIMASAASSCASGAQKPSHVLSAMGYSDSLIRGSLRMSLGYQTTDSDVDAVLDALPAAVALLREKK